MKKPTYLSCEWLGTHVATVGGISGVLTEMIIEMFFPGERPLAKLTPMWRFASMDAHMIRQMLLTSKWLGAEVASVWRFACMLTHVIGQMFLPREGFGAILALVRWLTRVLPDVVHQVILPRKCFRTVLTAEGRLPCSTFYNEFAIFKRGTSFQNAELSCTRRVLPDVTHGEGKVIEWESAQRSFSTARFYHVLVRWIVALTTTHARLIRPRSYVRSKILPAEKIHHPKTGKRCRLINFIAESLTLLLLQISGFNRVRYVGDR